MSVVGLDEFSKRFAQYSDSYALIGGSACDLLFTEQGLDFRATHDLDIVILADRPIKAFAKALWQFVEDGGYRCGWRNDPDVHYYRFTEPTAPNFPRMIELFSRRPDFPLHNEDSVIAPLPIDDDISSLSAILLDDEYYGFLTQGLAVVEGISILDAAHLIPLKVRAHIDLGEIKASGKHVNTVDLKKHKRDVIALTAIVPVEAQVLLSGQIRSDMMRFICDMKAEDSDTRALEILESTFSLKNSKN